MPKEECEKYKKFQEQLKELSEGGGKRRHDLGVPVFWTVETDRAKELERSFMLTSGDPTKPELTRKAYQGELNKKLTVCANAFSVTAKAKIEAKGGTCELVAVKKTETAKG